MGVTEKKWKLLCRVYEDSIGGVSYRDSGGYWDFRR